MTERHEAIVRTTTEPGDNHKFLGGMVNICHPEPPTDLSNYSFHPRATTLHRLNLQVLPR